MGIKSCIVVNVDTGKDVFVFHHRNKLKGRLSKRRLPSPPNAIEVFLVIKVTAILCCSFLW